MPFHIDYRPEDFDAIIGNSAAISSLKLVLERKDRPHTYLFTGPSGCGKTTLARIVANKLGCVSDFDLIEINASNNRGIDTAREIMSNMHLHPMQGDIKVYLLEECFAKNTKVRTPHGNINIQDINIGDVIYNIEGKARVKNIFKNRILLNRVICLKLSNQTNIFCSKEHLFLTQNRGWVEAQKISKKDLILKFDCSIMASINQTKEVENDREKMSLLSKFIFDTKQKPKILFKCLSKPIKEKSYYSYLRVLWETIRGRTKRKIYSSFLQPILCGQMECASSENERGVVSSWKERGKRKTEIEGTKPKIMERISKTVFRKNEKNQSFSRSKNNRENKNNEKSKWDVAYLAWKTWWEWAIYTCTNTFVNCFGMAYGSYHQNETLSVRQKWVPFQLQSRYRERKIEVSDRGRWERAQNEEDKIARQKENGQVNPIRVENIEIYERGSNDKSFKGIIGDKERNQGYVNFYDLEINGHPSYFANNILVHNCHQTTKDAQNALLRALEDTPPHVYFLLCTTEPEKLLLTIRNRCSTFTVSKLPHRKIKYLISRVLRKERQVVADDIIDNIVSTVQGCPRQALISLEQVIGLDEEDALDAIQSSQVKEKQIIDLCKKLMDTNVKWKQIANIIKGIEAEPEKVRLSVLGWFGSVLLNNGDPRAALIIECFKEPFYSTGRAGLIAACYDVMS